MCEDVLVRVCACLCGCGCVCGCVCFNSCGGASVPLRVGVCMCVYVGACVCGCVCGACVYGCMCERVGGCVCVGTWVWHGAYVVHVCLCWRVCVRGLLRVWERV